MGNAMLVHRIDEINKIKDYLNKMGIVLIVGITTENDLLELSGHLGEIYYHPHSSTNGITHINKENLKELRNVDSGFTNNRLQFHTDRGTSLDLPPKLMILHCNIKALSGGENILSDGYKIISYLKHNNYHLYNYLTTNTEVIYKSGNEVYKGPVISRSKGSYIWRLYFDNRVEPNSEYYSHMKYLYKIVKRFSFNIDIQHKQTIVINNWRWIHGRKAFEGKREFWRLLIKENT